MDRIGPEQGSDAPWNRIPSTGGEACPGDARDPTVVDEAVGIAVERFGRLDGAVNLVGSILLKPAHLTKPEEWNGAAIAWLLEPGNTWVSGQVIGVDGGLAALRGKARA